MEEKASLMIKCSRISEQIDELQGGLDSAVKELEQIPVRLQQDKDRIYSEEYNSFVRKKETQLQAIEDAVNRKRQEVSNLLDSYPDLEKKEFAGKVEIQTLEDHLMEIYPASFIEEYMCLNPIPLVDDGEAYQLYTSTEAMVAGLKQGNIAGVVFNGLSSFLDKAADYPSVGLKAGLGFALFMAIGLVFSPFLFITGLSLLGLACGAQGVFVGGLLRRLYSVKQYLNDSYDEDIFQSDKADIMESVDSFFEDAKIPYIDAVTSKEFKFDEKLWSSAEKLAETNTNRLQAQKRMLSSELEKAKSELEQAISALDELEKKEREMSKVARGQYLGAITWKQEWLSQIFLDITSENKIKVMPYTQCNSLFYCDNATTLQNLGRLTVYQGVIHMHPNFSNTVVLDYKYNGGELMQFSTIPAKVLRLAYTEDAIDKQVESITNNIRSRTNNILGSCESITEFNKLMASFDAPGENFVVVHVFGLSAFNSQLISNMRNGGRVGFFFKFYLTVEELSEAGTKFPFDCFTEFFQVGDYPMLRTVGSLKKMLGTDQ